MIKLTFLGDIMCKQELLKVYKKGNEYDFSEIFSEMRNYFEKSDLVIGNLETPISKNKKELTSEKYCFSSPYNFAKNVYESGIKCVSTANNHCMDRGIAGIKATVDSLDEIGFLHTGIYKDEKRDPLLFNIGDLKIGMLSYTYGTNAFANKNYLSKKEKFHVNLFQNQELSNKFARYCFFNKSNTLIKICSKLEVLLTQRKYKCEPYERKENSFKCKKNLIRDIKKIKENDADLIIMCMHTGGQYNDSATKRTKNLVKFLLKNDINIIVGNHEHVVHGGVFKKINNKQLATFSLGNFDGIAGVYEKPFNKMAEYSIAWNVYIDENKNLSKTSFSVLKTVPTDARGIQTVLLFDLINKEKDVIKKNKLEEDMYEIAYRFSNIKYKNIQKEYFIE